jgi:hypothetical protein
MGVVFPMKITSTVIRQVASPNLPDDQPFEPRSFRQKISISDGLRLEFDLR